MFKIPQWEDDVPKSKVDFGKTNKVKNNKKLPLDLSLKPNKQKVSKVIKNNARKPQKNNNQSKENGHKVNSNKRKTFNTNDKNKKIFINHKHGESNTKWPQAQSRINSETSNNVNNVVKNKKKKPKKRKLDDEANNKNKRLDKLSNSDAPSKPKKTKLNDEELATEGSILLKTSKKKKKKEDASSNVQSVKVSLGSKEDKKKEKLKQILQQETGRTQINVSGDNLRKRMLERLKSAQFRFLNEKLYTTSGSEAQKLFQTDPDAFQTYHEGYQQQVKKWPVNPLDLIVKRISKMPKTHVIADMGCGSAALSRRVQQPVRSFDLVASAPRVEACDMAHTPLLAAAADAAVYCLALMGTDLTQYLLEANRVLKMGGFLLIAEVESRFDKVEKFVEDVERLGFKLKNMDESHKVFFFMEFVKVRDPPAKKGKLPAITLKPCLYKRR